MYSTSIEVHTPEDIKRWKEIKHTIKARCNEEHSNRTYRFIDTNFCSRCFISALAIFYYPKPGQPGYRASTVDPTIGEPRKLTVDEKKERKRAKRMIRKLKKAGKPIPQELLDKLTSMKPITEVMEKQKEKKAEEVADMVLFLASNRARYVTGQTFVIDGGLTA